MNNNVRRRLCATSLSTGNSCAAVIGLPLWSSYPCRSFFHDISRYNAWSGVSHSRRVSQILPILSSGSPTTSWKPPQGSWCVITWQSSTFSARFGLQRNERSGFEHKIWDRRKPLGFRVSQRPFCGHVRRLGSRANHEAEEAGRVKNGDRESHSRMDSSRSDVQKGSRKNSAGTTNASDSAQKHLMDRLPHMPQIHRPNKEELLAAATGFWSRLKIRFKWFSIRSARPFNADEIGAFFSWVLVGHVIWIVLGTTTFFSLAILAVNTVFAQGQSKSLSSGFHFY